MIGLPATVHTRPLVVSAELADGSSGLGEGAVLSSRTACSGAFCASKQHQSIMSSIQRHIGGAIRQAKLTFCRVCSRLRRAFYKRSSMVHVPRGGSCSNEARCARGWTVREEM